MVLRAAIAAAFVWLASASLLHAAEGLQQLVAGAAKEGEIVFVAGSETFGGRKGFADLAAAFNKKFGLNAKINFAPGPEMNSMAARVITEVKTGRASTDFYLGSQSHFALLHQEKVLENVDWSATFPWITKEMEVLPGESVLVYISLNGILYNAALIAKDKAPKSYADLVDPRFSPTWAGKMAIPPYVQWLADLSLLWGQEKVRDFARKLVPLSGGRLRYSEEERIISGEFPITANMGGAVEHMWMWEKKGAPLVAVTGSSPPITSYFQLGALKKAPHPNLAKLFVAFMASKEAQGLSEKYQGRTTHLVEGTRLAKYLAANHIKLQAPAEAMAAYVKSEGGEGLKFKEELAKMMKQ
ncbi:MAG TPA: substrate-binding domain-containing protein [Verrucomicrobiae bacterium]|jgi:iron(III) transport system substrate-binding protein|nr:substrate-binding domain-containing protein [Verrucomicrobiae bacterium]